MNDFKILRFEYIWNSLPNPVFIKMYAHSSMYHQNERSEIFLTLEELKRIIYFHSDLDNHCPMLKQVWLEHTIDCWEMFLKPVQIFDTLKEAQEWSEK